MSIKDQDLISIIIPTYNRVDLIGGTLDTLIAQTFKDWECLVVDDGSTDHTLELISFYQEIDPRIKYLSRPLDRTKGANSCRNYGLQRSNGNYVLWFDSDDLMAKDFLKKGIKELRTKEYVDFVFFNYEIFEDDPSNIIAIQDNRSGTPLEDYFSGKINFSTCGVIWRKESITALFDEKLRKCQELDFMFRNYRNNKYLKGLFLEQTAYFLRQHDNSIVNSFKLGASKILLSDIYVRNEIMKFFDQEKQYEVWKHQKLEYSRGLYHYFRNADFSDILKVFFSQVPKGKLTLLFFLRTLKKAVGRDYRLRRLLAELSSGNYNIRLD